MGRTVFVTTQTQWDIRTAASHIEDVLVGSVDTQLADELILVTTRRFVKRLVRELVGKVETSSPSPLVKDGCQVVVGVDQSLKGQHMRAE
jgi:hypothetical protein